MNPTERKMAAAILRFEDSRVTGPDSLRVSRLPAADKGGKWEICGICDGIEPDVFNRLKALLDAGRREEAWEGCLQYVLDNTAAVRSWLGSGTQPGAHGGGIIQDVLETTFPGLFTPSGIQQGLQSVKHVRFNTVANAANLPLAALVGGGKAGNAQGIRPGDAAVFKPEDSRGHLSFCRIHIVNY